MRLTITDLETSIRCGLRIDSVARFRERRCSPRPWLCFAGKPSVPTTGFPLKRFKRLGYEHVALNGQKGYPRPSSCFSRLPFEKPSNIQSLFAAKADCRHISARYSGERAGLRDPISRCITSTCRPAADVPDPAVQSPKFAHKGSPSSTRCERPRRWALVTTRNRMILLRRSQRRAARARRLEPQTDVLRVVSHTPVECQKLRGPRRRTGGLGRCHAHAGPGADQSSTPGGANRSPELEKKRRTKAGRLDHILGSRRPPLRRPRPIGMRRAQAVARLRSRPSDHVPGDGRRSRCSEGAMRNHFGSCAVRGKARTSTILAGRLIEPAREASARSLRAASGKLSNILNEKRPAEMHSTVAGSSAFGGRPDAWVSVEPGANLSQKACTGPTVRVLAVFPADERFEIGPPARRSRPPTRPPACEQQPPRRSRVSSLRPDRQNAQRRPPQEDRGVGNAFEEGDCRRRWPWGAVTAPICNRPLPVTRMAGAGQRPSRPSARSR